MFFSKLRFSSQAFWGQYATFGLIWLDKLRNKHNFSHSTQQQAFAPLEWFVMSNTNDNYCISMITFLTKFQENKKLKYCFLNSHVMCPLTPLYSCTKFQCINDALCQFANNFAKNTSCSHVSFFYSLIPCDDTLLFRHFSQECRQ